MIPKLLFMFWHDGHPPYTVRRMIDHVRKLNPTWKFRLLTSKTKCAKPPGFDKLIIQHQSDWYRISFIEKYGGVYMDASCFHIHPIEYWVDVDDDRLQGFKWPFRSKVMENWAFAAPPKHPFVVEWKKECELSIVSGIKSYVHKLPESIKKLDGFLRFGDYLRQHMAWKKVYQTDVPTWKSTIRLKKSTDVDGPYAVHVQHEWDTDDVIDAILKGEFDESIPFIKLTGHDREAMEDAIASHK